jgi:hypothetical protein
MQFLITDGQTFLHEERRHLNTKVEELDRWSLGYRIINTDPQGRYGLIKQVIADPHQPCVLIYARLEGEEELLERLQIFALVAPHLEVGGWGNSIRRTEVIGQRVLLAWKGRTFLAMGADVGFRKTSCGYVGASDGWQDLNHNLRMDWEFDRAENGNVAGIGELNLSAKKDFTIALSFGDGPHAAISTMVQSLAIPFAQHKDTALERFASGAGMLPEQVWDEAERPEHRLFLGRPAGSAMPLIWAHAEYVKLLRSVADGKVFDLIEPVAARYLGTRPQTAWQVWKPERRVQATSAGSTLRILAFSPFRLHWSGDGWQTISDTISTDTALGSFADIKVPLSQRAPVSFTFHWLSEDRWEGQDYQVGICPHLPATRAA